MRMSLSHRKSVLHTTAPVNPKLISIPSKVECQGLNIILSRGPLAYLRHAVRILSACCNTVSARTGRAALTRLPTDGFGTIRRVYSFRMPAVVRLGSSRSLKLRRMCTTDTAARLLQTPMNPAERQVSFARGVEATRSAKALPQVQIRPFAGYFVSLISRQTATFNCRGIRMLAAA